MDLAWTIFSVVFGQNVYAEQFAWKYFHLSFFSSKHESCLSFSLNVESVLFGFMFLKIKTNLRKGIVCLTWSVDLFRVVVLGNLKSSWCVEGYLCRWVPFATFRSLCVQTVETFLCGIFRYSLNIAYTFLWLWDAFSFSVAPFSRPLVLDDTQGWQNF